MCSLGRFEGEIPLQIWLDLQRQRDGNIGPGKSGISMTQSQENLIGVEIHDDQLG